MNALTVLATHAIHGSTARIYLYECRSVDVIYTYISDTCSKCIMTVAATFLVVSGFSVLLFLLFKEKFFSKWLSNRLHLTILNDVNKSVC